ncbi:MAG: carbamoyltransferase C-terminal domain-containing protein [bacterium]|nr:carbamoyltransferase C-terminal domain-containing protein [bacterium]
MKVLSINDGYTSGAALLVDGRIELMAQEERFNRIKNYGGAPEKTLEWIFHTSKVKPQEIDYIALAWETEPFRDIKSFQHSKHKYYSLLAGFLPRWIIGNDLVFKPVLFLSRKKRKKLGLLMPLLKKYHLENKKIVCVNHHLAHGAGAYFASGFKDKYPRSLVVSYDGSGDGLCSTVSVAEGNDIRTIFSQNPYDSIAIMYTRVTEFLGMKPLEHEYKLMGLAPYSPDAIKKKAYEKFKHYIKLSDDGLSFINTSHSWGNSFIRRLERDMRGIRFDGVAAGLQQLFEELMFRYIISWSKKTGIKNVVAGGGSFMNVKLNMLLAQSRQLNEYYVLPSCGDESLVMGAGLFVSACHARDKITPLKDIYFGYQIKEPELLAALKKYKGQIAFKKSNNIEKEAARLLAANFIVGRCKGRMEWGARALGNRTIMANPVHTGIIKKINKVVKQRDYWMPFAPSILFEDRNKYTVNPKQVDSPYMILAFESTDKAIKEIPAGLHPFDDTCRPQFVRQEFNPSYHKLIGYFKKLTGIGGIVNTSCNIHGYPIVCNAEDSIRMLIDSEIDYMAIENYLCWRRK